MKDERSVHVGSAVVAEGYNGGTRLVQLVLVGGVLFEVFERGYFGAAGIDPDCRFASVSAALAAVRGVPGRYLEVFAA